MMTTLVVDYSFSREPVINNKHPLLIMGSEQRNQRASCHKTMSTKTIIIAALLVILLPLSCEQLVRPLPSPPPTYWCIAGTLPRRPQAQE
jgi:hypothetical protein